MAIGVEIMEDIDTLHAHKIIAKRISLMLSGIDWVQQVKIINEL